MASDSLRSVSALLFKNPCVGFIKGQLDKRDVVAVEAGGFVPDIALAKQTDNGNGVAEADTCSLAPDTDPNQAFAEFMYW